ncbi:nitrite reductase (NAD(P)H) small subunit [Conexibacter sp. SYSU D00693]|uniref:Rieske (2Fe-2S) protein n=1 Tax=Conexibacter sp. SYSU D00693 TaxID=2812560 RepID=UPI00196BA5B7|nr:nitrite reductase (NAD(P)H) small subunit [Conexibacter sp. SYSU D00693]
MIPVCSVDDVPAGEGRSIDVEGRRIALFNTPTGWYAIDHACPHAGGPLADGIAADCSVICPLHERRYALDTGAPIGHAGGPVATHRVQVLDGRVCVALGEDAGADDAAPAAAVAA